MGEFEAWVFRTLGAIVLIFVGDYLRMRLSMSEKYVLKSDCKEDREKRDIDMASLIKANREDHKMIELKLDDMMKQIFEVVKGINKINGRRN